ncbi:MAG: ATP-binding cassette domain-containing protein [Sphingomonas sp.]
MSFDLDLAKRLGEAEIACRVAGEGLTVLFGPSGVGKTSVLNMVAGLARPDRGHIRVAGRTLFDAGRGIDLPPSARGAGYAFQDGRLFPHLRVAANLTYGLRPGESGPRVPTLDDVTALLDIAHLLDRWPRTLSGGEAQRVAIGRALLSDPAFLLLDEPLTSVDRPRREAVLRAIEHVRDDIGMPILMVTHDRAEAERLGERIVEM